MKMKGMEEIRGGNGISITFQIFLETQINNTRYLFSAHNYCNRIYFTKIFTSSFLYISYVTLHSTVRYTVQYGTAQYLIYGFRCFAVQLIISII
jgi:hypothetical protein